MKIKLELDDEIFIDLNSIEYDELEEAIYKIKQWCYKMEDEIFYTSKDYDYDYGVEG